MTHENDLIAVVDAAQVAGVTVSTIYRWHAAGRLPIYKRASRTLVRRADVTKALRPRRIAASKRSTRPDRARVTREPVQPSTHPRQ
jgi:excisionase family DNA binding protein